uniref:Sema domain-containing protein n=1 Tax=Denticeps clupeoides TaxID=299321 RepID=A0AAY4D4M8_9TELE
LPPSPRADRAGGSMSPSLLLIFIFLPLSAALRVERAFASETRTNNFAVDGAARRVYVAAVNALHQLNGTTLRAETHRRTGPVNDSRLCHAPQLPHAPCEHPTEPTDNHNQLLALDPAQRVLVACGSVHQGFCELLRADDVTRAAVDFPPPGARAVFPSMLNVAANDPRASTVGLVFRGPGGRSRLLVAATYTGSGTRFFPNNRSKEDLRFENTPEIAIRSLDAADAARLFTYDINPSEDNVLKIKQEDKPRNRLSFVRAFPRGGYAYLAMNNEAGGGRKESRPHSLLARICLDGPAPRRGSGPPAEGRKLTESYVQLGLQCGDAGNLYGRLVAAYPARQLLFGVFSRAGSGGPGSGSALCAFRFADVEEAIRRGRADCSTVPGSAEVQVLDSVIQGSGAVCVPKPNILQSDQLNCGAAHLQHPLALRRPLKATPIYEYPGLNSVAVDDVHNHTMVFLGTSSGKLRKISLWRNLTLANHWTLKVAAGESVHHIMTFDPNDRNYLYLMTSHHLLLVRVAVCSQYSSCSACLNSVDAYCGWCTLESRCSLKGECSRGNTPRAWIGIEEGAGQCPSMTLTPPEISVSADVKDMGILIDGSVPDLRGALVECDYGTGRSTRATVHLESGPAQIQTCPLLPRDQYPSIPQGRDHIIVPVAIRVDGVSVVSGSFVIYDCERTGEINQKTGCSSCLSTKWRCFWDQRTGQCVSSKEASQEALLENSTSCPSLKYMSIPPIPSETTEDFVLELENVDTHVIFLSSSSSVWGCRGTVFNSLPPLSPVEVYRCDSGSSDCSECWGREHQGHLCAWCDSTCRPRGHCQQHTHCPAPEIYKIHPRNGPAEGGTLLTIEGRNMGRRPAEVQVSVSGSPCRVIEDQYTVSVRLVCVTGRAEPLENVVTVRVENSSSGHSSEIFTYLEPRLTSLHPGKGPRSGGTRVTITGQHLDSGSGIRVRVNDTQDCSIHRWACSVECIMPAVQPLPGGSVSVCVEIDGNSCENNSLSSSYSYEQDPNISHIQPRKSYLSGGRPITVSGQGFDLVQSVFMEVVGIGRVECSVKTPFFILCHSPPSDQSREAVAQFYLNGVVYRGDGPASSELGLEDEEEEEEPYVQHFQMEYVEDPQFYTANRERLIKHHPGEPLTLIITKAPGSLDLEQEEYSVMIGSYPCDISFHNTQLFHCTINGTLSSSERELPVTVCVGNLRRVIARVQLGGRELAIIVSIVVCSVLLLLCTVALVVYCTKSRRAERYWQKTLLQMEEMESQIREEIRKGFAELQTDMTDLTKELNRSQGIPFLEYKQFVTRTFFPKLCSDYERSLVQTVYDNDTNGLHPVPETHPLLQDWQASNTTRPNIEEGITLFSTLLNNKHFLITFVHALEQQRDFAVRDRCNLASLLTIALHGKLEYYTSIMKELLVDLIDASASKNPKLMLRRTESVVEKMLTNWMSICMYSYLKETVGEPFFLLLCAIKQQINKGSIDAITGKARYTLNEEWLLRENIEAKPQNVSVSFQGCGMDSVSVRVMNTDTICQVKEKILETFYKNLPFSQLPHAEDVDLEWFPGDGSSRILHDLDNTSIMEDGRKKLNTVVHYQIPEGAALAMSMKDKRDNTLGRAKDLDTEKYIHLVLPHDDLMETKRSQRQSHRKKVLPEIYLTRLLSTKGTLQKFLDDLFQAILSMPAERPPLAVKYFFDFLEEQADKRGISDPDTLHIWKTNSLPLRFWVNILKNPQFVFDIDKTDHMDACLSVIAQAFIDACSLSDLQLGKDSPTNKLLYAKEIPEYKKRVQCYYRQIQEMAPLSEQEMNAHLAEESRRYRNEFNTNLALTEIYKYAKRYRNQVASALEGNPAARRTQLHHKFEQVIALVEDNIYECCSEA